MALQRPRGNGGRRKQFGERHALATRVPVAQAEELFERAETIGISVSEYLAMLVARDLTEPAPTQMVRQEPLSMSA